MLAFLVLILTSGVNAQPQSYHRQVVEKMPVNGWTTRSIEWDKIPYSLATPDLPKSLKPIGMYHAFSRSNVLFQSTATVENNRGDDKRRKGQLLPLANQIIKGTKG